MAPISAEQVVNFLEENPDFFLDNPKLVQTSGLLKENESGETLIDIRTRLFDRLNDERLELMALLDETIELVRQNEQIEGDFLAIETLLFRPAPTGTSLTRIAEEIEERFSLAHVSFLICAPAKGALREEMDEPGRIRLINENDGEMPGDVLLAGGLEGGESLRFPRMYALIYARPPSFPCTTESGCLACFFWARRTPGATPRAWRPNCLSVWPRGWEWESAYSCAWPRRSAPGARTRSSPGKRKKTPQNLPDPHGA